MSGKNNKEATPLTEEQLSQKDAELNEKETNLKKLEESLSQKEIALTEKEEALLLRETELNEKETNLNELEESLLKTETSEATPEPEPGLDFKIDKEKFKFKDSSPKNFRIGGKVLSQEEIVKDKALLQKLIKGSHIEKIK